MEKETGLLRARLLAGSKVRSRVGKVITALCCVVAFCTTYALILPAITANATAYCGIEEHEHTDACYEKVLVCGLEEGEGSADDEADEGSTAQGHVHDDSCYETRLVCGKDEHVHALACYSNPNADLETAEDWEKTVPTSNELCGEWTVDLLSVAKSQLGYEESTANYQVASDGVTTKGYTRYGAWYGDPYGDWCAMFASFCLHYAGVDEEKMPLDANCQSWVSTLSEKEINLYHSATTAKGDAYEPQAGQLVFFNNNVDDDVTTASGTTPVADHVGIVLEYVAATESKPAQVKTIEGNLDDKVSQATYELGDERILGFAELPSSPAASEAKVTESNEAEEAADEDETRVQNVIKLINALPTQEEIDAAFDAEGDDADANLADLIQQVRTTYAYYEDLGPDLQKQVPNASDLLQLEWLWSASTLAVTDSATVYQVNSYSQAVTTVVSGGSVQAKLGSGMSFTYWDVVIVEKDSGGNLYVAQYIMDDGDKRDCVASTADGFVILLYNTSLNVGAGNYVSVDFDYKTAGSYNSDGYGTVTFSDSLEVMPKPKKDNSSKLTIVPGADTRDLIEVNLYDYGTNINDLYYSDKKYPGFQQDKGSTNVGDSLSRWASFNFGNNITSDLAAGEPSVTNQGGDINATTNGANSPISEAMQSTLGNDGQPALADGTSLGYLFSNNTYATKMNSQSINGLFRYDEDTGAYTFNSRENHAQFNSGDDTFTLYEQIITSNFMMYPFGNFLPFNDITKLSAQASTIDRTYLEAIASSAQYKYNNGDGDAYGTLSTQLNKFIGLMDAAYPDGWTGADCINEYFKAAGISRTFSNDEELVQNLYSIDYDEPTDFYFGMEMKMNFMQPKGGLTGKDGKQPMVFYFTGDDDVWVYLDGELALDLSGIHRHVGGEIDFVNGEIRYYSLDTSTGDVSTTPYKTVKFSEVFDSSVLNDKGTFKDYSTHSFNFYYMERGSGSGVCRMNFNFPLLHKNSISVTKELTSVDDSGTEVLGNPDFQFQVMKENGNDLFISAGTEFAILDSTGTKVGTGTVDANGVFTLKAGQTAVFSNIEENAGSYYVRELLDSSVYSQYGTISVDGSTATAVNEITIGEDTFTGLVSPVKDMSEGNTSFVFENKFTPNKLGSLSLKKELAGGDPGDKSFSFNVELDGTPLPQGTSYAVEDNEGTIKNFTVEQEGVIQLKAGETAVISGIIAGSRFEVTEQEESSNGYTVKYSVNDADQGAERASGMVSASDNSASAPSVEVVVTNSAKGCTLAIPLTKVLTNPDGNAHMYIFQLQQVTDSSGETSVENGTSYDLDISLPASSDDSQTMSDSIRLSYLGPQITNSPATFYYKVTEAENPNEINTAFDTTSYVVKVTVTNSKGQDMTAEITALWKDGESVDISDLESLTLTFENTLRPAYKLPESGGLGTAPFTVGGLLLTIGAGLLLMNRYRQSSKRRA